MEAVSKQAVPFLSWLRGLGVAVEGVTEEQCRQASQSPDHQGFEKIRSVRAVVVHHSATEEGGAEAFRVLHRIVRGWRDVGYHFVIGNGTHSPDGQVEPGRPEYCRGAHAKGANEFSLGVCMVGNFMRSHPTESQLRSLGAILYRIMKAHGIPREGVMLHRQVKGSSTDCPGRNLTLAMVHETIDSYINSL